MRPIFNNLCIKNRLIGNAKTTVKTNAVEANIGIPKILPSSLLN